MDDWKKFEEECENCRACPLWEGRNNIVVYRGAKEAPLMIIGEAPGENEDLQGKPFVGRSGALLQNLLATYGFTDNDYHICNICKCRPPNNRRPTPDEIKACKTHLAKQFRMVKPKVILLCGSTAYEGFFGNKPVMKEVRGTVIEKNGFYIITTYHPAYALRNPKNKIPIYDDMGKVRQLLTDLNLMPPL